MLNNKADFLLRLSQHKNKVLKPTKEEIIKNNRSRSAKLRFATRSKNKFEYPKGFIKKFKRYLDSGLLS